MNYFKTLNHLEAFAFCVDATNPPENLNQWVEPNKLYKVKGAADALNQTDTKSIILLDKEGNVMRPSPSLGGYREDRFKFMHICKN